MLRRGQNAGIRAGGPGGGRQARRAALALLGWALLAAAGAFAQTNRGAAAESLTILQWNVENLFDFEDDPANSGDDPFTPDGWQYWSEGRYRLKLAHLSGVVAGAGADIVCVEEIENRRVLDDLAAALRDRHGRDFPNVIHREGTDHRGIDVAILSALKPARARWLTPVKGQRDILVADFEAGGCPFTVFVNHWKSRWGPAEEATRMRTAQARAVRAELDRLLAADPAARVLVLGDFNDDFTDPSIVEALRSVSDLKQVLSEPERGWLYNLHAGLAEAERGTFYYRLARRWNSFDTISVTRGMLAGASGAAGGWKVKPGSYCVFRADEAVDGKGLPRPFRRITNEQTRQREYSYGYSDHFPVRVTIVR